jgi:hypothetical protein
MIGVTALTVTSNEPCFRESNYYCIQVNLDESGELKELTLDALVNGIVSLRHPNRLVYPHQRLYTEVVDARYGRNRPLQAFAIGGGTYTFPRYLERVHHADTLVAEIDPEVTEVVRSEFGLRESPGLQIVNRDARPVLRKRPKSERYDIVLGDAFTDLAIPFHLVTREFNELVRSHLKPDGVYLVNVVDGVHFDFLRSYVKTLQQTFPQVRLLVSSGERTIGRQSASVVVASQQPLPQTRSMLSGERLDRFLNERDTVILTDDHVPVDQLLAPVFRQRLHQRATTGQAGA